MVLITGIILSLLVGVGTGNIAPQDIFKVMASGANGNSGIVNMYDIAIISLVVAGIIGLVKDNGGIDFILEQIKRKIHSKKGAQLGIALLSSLVDVSTANNTVAIVMAGPIAKDIAKEYGITPKRTASLLDIFTSAWQGIIPYGAQLLYASAGAAAAGIAVSPVEFLPYLYYPVFMAISAVVYIFAAKHD